MKSICEIVKIVYKYEILFMLDVVRWVENCYFIKMNEEGYRDKFIVEIVKEMFFYCDGFIVFFKKDGYVNMGGILVFCDKGYFWKKFFDFNEDGIVKIDVGILLKVK